MIDFLRPVAPYGFAIFCDDIRQEIGNKATYVGAYGPDFIIDATFPVTVPKICIVIHAVLEAVDHSVEIELRVCFPGDDPVEGSFWVKSNVDPNSFSAILGEKEGLTPRPNLAYSFVLQNVVIKEPGFAEVFLKIVDKTYRIGRLKIANFAALPSS